MDERDAKIVALEMKVIALEEDIAALKRHLGLDSSKVPSSDGLRKRPAPVNYGESVRSYVVYLNPFLPTRFV
jgi:hypothetical protein